MPLLDHSVNSEKDDKALPMIRQRKVKVHIINLWPKICVVIILFTFLHISHLTYSCIYLFPQMYLICSWLIDSLQYQNQIYFKYQFYSKYHKHFFLKANDYSVYIKNLLLLKVKCILVYVWHYLQKQSTWRLLYIITAHKQVIADYFGYNFWVH